MLVTIQIPDREVEHIDEFVRALGQSRAAFVRAAIRHRMEEATPAAAPRQVRVRKPASDGGA